MPRRVLLYSVGFLVLLWLCPQPVFAYIPHWDPKEGFFVRQSSYLLFLGAMLFFIYELKQENLQKRRGFRFLALASWLFALWNLDCFVGQFSSLMLKPVTSGEAGSFSQRLLMSDLNTWIYYLSKLDHLLLVPAFYFFYLGIKAFGQDLEMGRR